MMPAGSSEPASLLVIDGASASCLVALLVGGQVVAQRREDGQGAMSGAVIGRLPGQVAAVLAEAGLRAAALGGIAVTVGPGSFTGLRATLALAQGLAFGAAIPLTAVTLGEAIRADLPLAADPPQPTVWVALDSRRGRIFLDRGADIETILPHQRLQVTGTLMLAGDAAPDLALLLDRQGHDVLLTASQFATAAGIAAAAQRRLSGALPPLAAVPLYVDPPLAALPAGGLRPAPV